MPGDGISCEGEDAVKHLINRILTEVETTRERWRQDVKKQLDIDKALIQLSNLAIAYWELYKTVKNLIDAYDKMCEPVVNPDEACDAFRDFCQAKEQLHELRLFERNFFK